MNCENCGIRPKAREGRLCAGCAKADWRRRRTPAQVEADRERDRARKKLRGDGVTALNPAKPKTRPGQETFDL